MKNRKSVPIFVVAAQISAHIDAATKVAQQLSLTAKNARAITARAGQVAVGFAAITNFIQDLATATIELALKINQTAIQMAAQATQLERANQANYKFNLVQKSAADADFIDSIKPMLAINETEINKLNHHFLAMLGQLSNLLDETAKQTRSAKVISSMSKIEAAQSGNYQTQLEVIAVNIEQSALKIQSELTKAAYLLDSTGIKL